MLTLRDHIEAFVYAIVMTFFSMLGAVVAIGALAAVLYGVAMLISAFI